MCFISSDQLLCWLKWESWAYFYYFLSRKELRVWPLDYRTGLVVLSFKKGGCAPAVWGITLLSLPGKVYAGVLERRIHPLVKHQMEDVQCSFHPGHRTLALYPLEAVRECVGVCPTVYRALWTWRRYSTAVLGVSCERCFRTIGYFAVVKGQLVPVQLPWTWSMLATISWTHSWWMMGSSSAALHHQFYSTFYFYIIRTSWYSKVAESLRFGGPRILTVFNRRLVSFGGDLMHFAAVSHLVQSVKQRKWEFSISKSRAMTLSWKRVACPIPGKGRPRTQWQDLISLTAVFAQSCGWLSIIAIPSAMLNVCHRWYAAV